MLTLVTGGSASGKSEYAENLLPKDDGCVYLATMESFGKEAEARIERHRNLRSGKGFTTVECPVNLVTCLDACSGKNVLLEDLPNLVANETFRPDGNGTECILRHILELVRASESLVCVTGILTADGRSYNGETVKYLRELARIENALAQRANRVVEVVCGIGGILKSDLEKRQPLHPLSEMGGHKMIFVTGPMYSGKRSYMKKALGLSDAEFEKRAVWNVEELVGGKIWEDRELLLLADKLAQKDIVIANETGCGVIPLEKSEREWREWSGRLACMLAERADTVIRVVCGCPQILKGGT